MKNTDYTILIIDDESDACFLLEKILHSQHIKSISALNLAKASKILAYLKPEIIFLDNHIEDKLGIDFICELKNISAKSKIVIITAQDSFALRQAAFNKGADSFIGKPFTKNKIFETIHELSNLPVGKKVDEI